jgi:hypothetical protein
LRHFQKGSKWRGSALQLIFFQAACQFDGALDLNIIPPDDNNRPGRFNGNRQMKSNSRIKKDSKATESKYLVYIAAHPSPNIASTRVICLIKTEQFPQDCWETLSSSAKICKRKG